MWVTPLMELGTVQQLDYKDLLTLPEQLDPSNCSKYLLESWAKEKKRTDHDPSFLHAIYIVYRWQYLLIGIVKVVIVYVCCFDVILTHLCKSLIHISCYCL
jgi:hypothetical protein